MSVQLVRFSTLRDIIMFIPADRHSLGPTQKAELRSSQFRTVIPVGIKPFWQPIVQRQLCCSASQRAGSGVLRGSSSDSMDDGGEPVIVEALLMMSCSFFLVLMTRLKPITGKNSN